MKRPTRKVRRIGSMLIPSLFILFLLKGISHATGTDPAASDLLDDFDRSAFARPDMGKEAAGQEDSTAVLPFDLSIFGTFKQSISVHFAHDANASSQADKNGINSLKPSLFIGMDAVFSPLLSGRIEVQGYYDGVYALKGRQKFEPDLVNENESDVEIFNAYLDARPSPWSDLRIGRQVLVWGVSDNFRVTDTLNPIDYTEPGRTDLAESRLPVFMTKLDIFLNEYHLSAVCVPERRWNRYPVFGSSFYPFDVPLSDTEEEGIYFNAMDLAAKVSRSFEGWDIAVYTSRFRDKTPVVQFSYQPLFKLNHPKITMTGASICIARNNLLFKIEAGYFTGIRFSDHVESLFHLIPVSNRTYEKTEAMVGIDYTGIKDTFITIETLNSFIHGHDAALEQAGVEAYQLQGVVKLIRFFDNNRGALTLQSAIRGEKGQGGSIHRIKVSYDLSDSLNLTWGLIFYGSGKDAIYRNLGENDMFFLDFKYCF